MLVTVIAGAVLSLLAASCSNSRANSGATTMYTTTTAVATTTTIPVTTVSPTTPPTPVPTTTTAALPTTTTATLPPTTTTEPPTTTTEPPGAALPLRADGVGDATFGNDPDEVISYLSGIFGTPTADTGWVGGVEVGCKGTSARVVFWNDLRLTFGDESNVASGRRHFFAWRYGPPFGTSINPAGMTTAVGLTIGAPIDEVLKDYPGAQVITDDTVATPTAELADGLTAFLTDTGPRGSVTTLLGGQNCTSD
ncbi:MAG: hypothetical protein JWN39_1402 [Ilumatobacteraceae bacterium]|nr:hypothetical protein [Ilumatobacteraceae bacterium]